MKKLAMCVVMAMNVTVASAKNLYNDWAQENAVNLNASAAQNPAAQNPSAPMLQQIKQEALSCKDEWSGSLEELKALVDRAKQKYGNESTKHMGRNATMIVPANLGEMKRWGEEAWKDRMKQWLGLGDKILGSWITTSANPLKDEFWSGYHSAKATKADTKVGAFWNAFGSGVKKYMIEDGEYKGSEVVYDKETGTIVKDWRMGTRNYSYVIDGSHRKLDMNTHEKNPEYKYVGILVETDPSDPNNYYIINGQTGKRMTWREAEDFPTTLSDEWKVMGLACAPDDVNDVIEPDECRDEAKCIDTSQLESLLKEQIAFDLSLLQKGQQKGEKATDSEIANHNARCEKILQEIVSICKKIDVLKLSDEEKVQRLRGTLAPIMDKYAASSKSIAQKLVDSKIVERLQSPLFNLKEVVDVGFLNSDAAKAVYGK